MRKTNNEVVNSEVQTLAEAATFLRVSERTLWNLVKEQRVPVAKVGRQYRFCRGRLVQWLHEQATAKFLEDE